MAMTSTGKCIQVWYFRDNDHLTVSAHLRRLWRQPGVW